MPSVVRKPGLKPENLDNHTSNRIFVAYSATTKNIYYIDDATLVVKNSVQALFDEAHFTAPWAKTPLAAHALHSLGYSVFRDEFSNGKFKSKHKLQLKLISSNATTPVRNTTSSIGYDIFTSSNDAILHPGESSVFNTGIIVAMTPGYYLDLTQPQADTTIVWKIYTTIIYTFITDKN